MIPNRASGVARDYDRTCGGWQSEHARRMNGKPLCIVAVSTAWLARRVAVFQGFRSHCPLLQTWHCCSRSWEVRITVYRSSAHKVLIIFPDLPNGPEPSRQVVASSQTSWFYCHIPDLPLQWPFHRRSTASTPGFQTQQDFRRPRSLVPPREARSRPFDFLLPSISRPR